MILHALHHMEQLLSAVGEVVWWPGFSNSVSIFTHIFHENFLINYLPTSEKPAIVNCPYTGTGLTSWLTTDADGNTPDGCDPATNYEQLTFAQCSHTEPDKTNTFHLAVSQIHSIVDRDCVQCISNV